MGRKGAGHKAYLTRIRNLRARKHKKPKGHVVGFYKKGGKTRPITKSDVQLNRQKVVKGGKQFKGVTPYDRCPKCGRRTTKDRDGKRVEINCPVHGRVVVFDRGLPNLKLFKVKVKATMAGGQVPAEMYISARKKSEAEDLMHNTDYFSYQFTLTPTKSVPQGLSTMWEQGHEGEHGEQIWL